MEGEQREEPTRLAEPLLRARRTRRNRGTVTGTKTKRYWTQTDAKHGLPDLSPIQARLEDNEPVTTEPPELRNTEQTEDGIRLKALRMAFLVWERFNLRVIPPKFVFIRDSRREARAGGCFPCCFQRQSV